MATCCIHCGVEEGEIHLSNCPALQNAFDSLQAENERLKEENERLRSVEKGKEEVVKLLKISNRKLGEVENENERLTAQVEQYKEIAKWDWVQQQERTMKELKNALDDAEKENERLREVIEINKYSYAGVVNDYRKVKAENERLRGELHITNKLYGELLMQVEGKDTLSRHESALWILKRDKDVHAAFEEAVKDE
jgi:hypothetical protein